jgi:hypothetical protein
LMGKLRRWWARIEEWRRAPARAKELEERVAALTRTNYLLVKGGLRDKARIGHLENQLVVFYQDTPDVPGLTPGEIERLAILAEECGEIAQAVGKVLRFGWERRSPYGGRQNRGALEREIGSLRAIVNLMLDVDDLRLTEVQAWQRAKRAGLAKWTLYQDCSMPREEQLAMMAAIAERERGTR